MVIVKVKENLNFRRKRNRYPEAPTRPDNTRRSIALRQYVNISALQLFAFARQRGEMLQEVAGEARRRAQITQNSIFQFSEIYHFFNLSSTPLRRTNSLISLALSQTTPSNRSFTYQSLEVLF